MILGITGQNHDASMALINGSDILWAGHAERYSRIKNDESINQAMVDDMRQYGNPDQIIWFERPLLKSLRRLYSGQRPWYDHPRQQLKNVKLDHLPVEYAGHHESHAAGGFYTSTFDNASILVVDAIGEWNSVSIWVADDTGIRSIWRKNYPDSMGLFYTAFTDYLGLKPNEEEYILMGMAAYGQPVIKEYLKQEFFKRFEGPDFRLRHNLHRGCRGWSNTACISKFDIAASVQAVMEDYLIETVRWMKERLPSGNLILMGGCALNCVANSRIAKLNLYDNIWIMPNPGDAGSAIGAVAAHTQQRLQWSGPLLGTNIDRELDYEGIVRDLQAGHVVAVANGRAEFGPRALGNRSLLCDPRGPDAKSRMNRLKRREEFRPFAPAILEEYTHDYFDLPVLDSPYMQFIGVCQHQDELPGICHVDGTSRIQTVAAEDNPNFRTILELWKEKTGCPILMNTSLNVKGEPLVNSWEDAIRWQQINGVKVY